jgi:pyruvate kinase
MRPELIATLGPSSATTATWRAMLSAGVTGLRLNTSHLSLEALPGWLERLQSFLAPLEPRPALVLDLQGSKWRLGRLPAAELRAGQRVELLPTAESARPDRLPVPHPDFFQAADGSSGEIVLNDGKVRLQVETLAPHRLLARVTQGGPIAAGKGLTFHQSTYRKESLSEKDRAIVALTAGMGWVRYALSYLRDAAEMARYRFWFGPAAYLIAKLERSPALAEAAELGQAADELWLCRGDLGAELGLPAMAGAVYRFSQRLVAGEFHQPVLLARQVLEHLTEHPTPTRSEVCYLYEALVKGYRGVVLSDETAIGRDPVNSCRVAVEIMAGAVGGSEIRRNF